MKRVFLLVIIAVTMLISSCRKDKADDWAGTYNGQSGLAIQRVVIEKVDNTTLKIQLQTPFLGSFVTYATIEKAKITSSDAIKVNEDGLIAGYTDIHHFEGSGTLNGTNLTISGTATNKSNSGDVKPYYFTGDK